MAGRLRDALRAVAERVTDEASERDVATLFAETGVYETLGYEGTGVDLRSEYSLPEGERPDLLALDSTGGVQVVFEFKPPGTRLAAHEAQLWGYTAAVSASYGVVTDGRRLAMYDGRERVASVALATATADEAARLGDRLCKTSYDLRDPAAVADLLAPDTQVDLGEAVGREHFFDTFRLAAESSFGRLVRALLAVYRATDDDTVRETFDYWRATHTGLPEDPPDAWDEVAGDAEPAAFVFCLETAHALVSRLLLAKAVGDHEVFDTSAGEWMRDHVAAVNGPGEWIPVTRYPQVAASFVHTMRDQLVRGAFRDDVFGWWTECVPRREPTAPSERGDPRRGTWSDTPAAQFGRAVGRVTVDVLRFDFARVTGDLLGSLYQQYFDPETRKALGEFYTPEALAETILTDVGYEGSATAGRLLDPACGSGAFLVAAVRRYLDHVHRSDPNPDWPKHLRRLCTKPSVVGLDVHPFAVLMAQIRFVVAILPEYAAAKEQADGFTLRRLPIYRTDSLRKEPDGWGEDGTGAGEQTPLVAFEEGDRDVYVPVAAPGAGDVSDDRTAAGHPVVNVRIPRFRTVAEQTAIGDRGEYFAAMQGVMDTVREHARRGWAEYEAGLRAHVERYTDGTYPDVAAFFGRYVTHLLEAVGQLPERAGGRRVDAFENTTLAVILKHYVTYDFVVGNPPYVRTQTLSADRKETLAAHYETATGAYDLYCPFYERAVEWAADGGRVGYVSPDGFLVTEYGRALRELLAETRIERLYDFRDSGVFADATNYPAVVVATVGVSADERAANDVRCVRVKRDSSDVSVDPADGTDEAEVTVDESPTTDDPPTIAADRADARTGSSASGVAAGRRAADGTGVATAGEELDARVMRAIRAHRDGEGTYDGPLVDAFDVPQERLGGEPWAVMPPDEWRVFRRLQERADARLADVTSAVFQGLRTGANGVYVVRVLDADRVAANDTGGVVTVEPTGETVVTQLETDLLRPFLAGRDVSRWRGDWSGLHVLFPYCETPDGSVRPVTADELAELPKTQAYLRANREQLTRRDGGRFTEGDQWWVYARTQNLRRMAEPKIVGREIADRATFAADEHGDWAFTTAYGVRVADRYADRTVPITAQLNSRVADFYLRHVAPIKNAGYYSYRARYLERVPLVTDDGFPEVRETVDEVLAAHDARSRVERFPEPYLDDTQVTRLTYEWATTRRPVEPTVRVESADGGWRFVVGAGRTDTIRDPALGGVVPRVFGGSGDGGSTATQNDRRVDEAGPITVEAADGVTLERPDGTRVEPTTEARAAAARAAYVRQSVADRSVRAGETTTVPIPRSDEAVVATLESAAADRRRWETTELSALESRIDRLVADAFGLSEADRRVIERFCETY